MAPRQPQKTHATGEPATHNLRVPRTKASVRLSRRAALERLGVNLGLGALAMNSIDDGMWAAAAGSRIVRIDVFPVRYPMRGRFKFFEGPEGSPEGRPAAGAVHSCGSGVAACHNLLAMEVAGLEGGKLYAGSWSEWIADPQRPRERG